MLTSFRFEFFWRLNLLLNNGQEELELVWTRMLEQSVKRGSSFQFIQDFEPCKYENENEISSVVKVNGV